MEARGVAGRTITLMLFLVVLLLYTCYSASIVVLLQSTATPISHFRDLINSRIKAGVIGVPYIIRYLNVSHFPPMLSLVQKNPTCYTPRARDLSSGHGVIVSCIT